MSDHKNNTGGQNRARIGRSQDFEVQDAIGCGNDRAKDVTRNLAGQD